jgi:ribonucrease Y
VGGTFEKELEMTQALIGVLALVAGIAIGYAVRARLAQVRLTDAERQAERILRDAESRAETQLKEAKVAAREELLHQRAEQERELGNRRAELVKIEERVIAKEEQLQTRLDELARRDQSILDRETHAKQMQEELKTLRDQQLAELERVAGLTAQQARDALLTKVEDETRHDMAKLVRQIEEEAKTEADRRARNILSIAI